eukprot:gnl/TRDRNA2_/TRDRNA2_160244_c1_seq1.p1 gnl/TRDRNA2_/TRDRNA2_160244_c1~~gnl/TRDRNA2_/TRDRNA2_160244_c1_seq1.p1  ORF type:complete len:296 (-),score=65.01 gnl/TRDRNA2_/TRDRNA2_160244_c1_seq1:413-1300(-)
MASAEGLRSTLKKYRDQGRISSKLYSDFYGKAKGGMFKSEKLMLEHLHKAMAEANKEAAATAAADAKKQKAIARRERQAAGPSVEAESASQDVEEQQFSVGQAVVVDYNGESHSAVISYRNDDDTYRVVYTVDNTYEDVQLWRLSSSLTEAQDNSAAETAASHARGVPAQNEIDSGAGGAQVARAADSPGEADEKMLVVLEGAESLPLENRRDQLLDLVVLYIQAVGEPVSIDRLNVLASALRSKFSYGIGLRKKKGSKDKLKEDERLVVSPTLLGQDPRLTFTEPCTVSLSETA